MKWQSVPHHLMAMALLTAGILLVLQRQLFFIPELFTPAYTDADLQLGYYDLLSKKRELYNTRFDTLGNVVVMTLSSPNDNRFRIKIRLEQQKTDPQGMLFDYIPVYIANPNEESMIGNILGNMPLTGVRFDGFTFQKVHVVVTPSGQILSYRNQAIGTLPTHHQRIDE